MENIALLFQLLPKATLSTVYMVFVSSFFATLIGGLVGVFLVLTAGEGLYAHSTTHRFLSFIVNVGRAIPFAILMIAIFPFTRLLIGTSIGTSAAIVPLSLAAIPFMARITENAFGEVSLDLVETALILGASPAQVMTKVLFRESLPSLIRGVTLMVVLLIGYSTMAGLIGGGGLGKVAIQYGYQRFNGWVMLATLCVLVLLVELVQKTGNAIAKKIEIQRGER